jgi:hypothetical protein
MVNMTLTTSLQKTSPSHRKRRVTKRGRRTLESGAISKKSPRKKLMNVAQNNHWWLILKKRRRNLIQNMIKKIMGEDISST